MSRFQTKGTMGNAQPSLRKVVDNQSVGEILRDSRLERDEDLAEVADALKIRQTFIEALETDNFSELPGAAYGIGFVRAYAKHLGLDSSEIVELFKAQSRAFDDQTQLVFPEPMPGSRVPTGLVILLSLMLIVGAFVGWTILSNENKSIADLVPPVPEFLKSLPAPLASLVGGDAGIDAEMEISGASVDSSAETTDPAIATAIEETTVVEPTVVEPTEDLNPVDTGLALAGASDALEAVAIVDSDAAPVVDGNADNASVAASPGEAEAASSFVEPVVPASGSVADSDTVDIASAIPEALVEEVTVYGETEGASRVSIVARQATWLEISDSDGAVLLTRLLRKGDTYRAPDRSGLTLVTGNAGGLEFLVDGQVVPDIGPIGSVRRDVDLSPAALIAGLSATQ